MQEQPSSTGGAFGVTNPGTTPTNMALRWTEGDDRRPGDSSEGPREVWKAEDGGRLRTVLAHLLWSTLVTMAMATAPPAGWQRYFSGEEASSLRSRSFSRVSFLWLRLK